MSESAYQEVEPNKALPYFVAGGLALFILGFFYLGVPEEIVTRDQYGELWPYPDFEQAKLDCTSRETPLGTIEYVTIKLGNVTYGLNGVAQSYLNLPDSRTQMRTDQHGLYVLGAVAELIRSGQRLC